ncbi:endonuclease Q family protein [Dendrosporobacter sp. 1207_IL3150]|uniref:endonuclease Q family protein n=1 Tax=Dendrosporobacter sp. 1207_IL3150 TaxID=3084054 RepID=UPI002FD9696A
MKRIFADLHIHVGISEQGQWVKIPTSRRLTIRNIFNESIHRKGLDLIGVVDALSPLVLEDLERLEAKGLLLLLSGGGYRYKGILTVLLGAEIETTEVNGGQAHSLIFLPSISEMREFCVRMSRHIKNINLSSQNAHMTLGDLINIASEHEAMIIPAHIFTPHKSLFGVCCDSLEQILTDNQIDKITAVELGLSADSVMGDRIAGLDQFSFLSNSDAHSLEKIAREYNVISVADSNYTEFYKACLRKEGRQISVNYGLNPRLGKYYRTFCAYCGTARPEEAISISSCYHCGKSKYIKGVKDRIDEIAFKGLINQPQYRAPYIYQIPLEFLPGIGKKTIEKLLHEFGTEINILHRVTFNQLISAIGERLAKEIETARTGQANIIDGGGGIYGRIFKNLI